MYYTASGALCYKLQFHVFATKAFYVSASHLAKFFMVGGCGVVLEQTLPLRRKG
jgi:hypothetical protein